MTFLLKATQAQWQLASWLHTFSTANRGSNTFSTFRSYQPPFEGVTVKVIVLLSEDGLLFGVIAFAEPDWLSQVWNTRLRTTTRPERGQQRGVRRADSRKVGDTLNTWPPVCYLWSDWESTGCGRSLWESTGSSLASDLGAGVRTAWSSVGSATANTKIQDVFTFGSFQSN